MASSASRVREQMEDFVATTRAEYDAEQEARAEGDAQRPAEPEA